MIKEFIDAGDILLGTYADISEQKESLRQAQERLEECIANFKKFRDEESCVAMIWAQSRVESLQGRLSFSYELLESHKKAAMQILGRYPHLKQAFRSL